MKMNRHASAEAFAKEANLQREDAPAAPHNTSKGYLYDSFSMFLDEYFAEIAKGGKAAEDSLSKVKGICADWGIGQPNFVSSQKSFNVYCRRWT
ncbi:uncharacterized protein LOC105167897 isoform X3 [Sesamum indicum]|nr:uncharacterized protein LOC105167897 isoform X3 [Sesamum indicum]